MWERIGHISGSERLENSGVGFMTPTPFMIGSNLVRIFGGIRDHAGVSRIHYIDVSLDNPTKIVNRSTKPVLDVGAAGMFDDNGVILGDVVKSENGVTLLFYVGFQKVAKVKFLAFSGLARGNTDGSLFERISSVPFFDRSVRGTFVAALHSVRGVGGEWRCWYAAGSGWTVIDDQPYPQYQIWSTRFCDNLNISQDHAVSVPSSEFEYRVGRPRVLDFEQKFKGCRFYMMFTYGDIKRRYQVGFACSGDGQNWTRRHDKVFLPPNANDWENEMICYPAPIVVGDAIYAFYNGNGMGKTGVGVARISIKDFRD